MYKVHFVLGIGIRRFPQISTNIRHSTSFNKKLNITNYPLTFHQSINYSIKGGS